MMCLTIETVLFHIRILINKGTAREMKMTREILLINKCTIKVMKFTREILLMLRWNNKMMERMIELMLISRSHNYLDISKIKLTMKMKILMIDLSLNTISKIDIIVQTILNTNYFLKTRSHT